MKAPETYVDDEVCDFCDTETKHVIHDENHERDSSNDWKVCLGCGWRTSGYSSYSEHVEPEYLELLRKEYLK